MLTGSGASLLSSGLETAPSSSSDAAGKATGEHGYKDRNGGDESDGSHSLSPATRNSKPRDGSAAPGAAGSTAVALLAAERASLRVARRSSRGSLPQSQRPLTAQASSAAGGGPGSDGSASHGLGLGLGLGGAASGSGASTGGSAAAAGGGGDVFSFAGPAASHASVSAPAAASGAFSAAARQGVGSSLAAAGVGGSLHAHAHPHTHPQPHPHGKEKGSGFSAGKLLSSFKKMLAPHKGKDKEKDASKVKGTAYGPYESAAFAASSPHGTAPPSPPTGGAAATATATAGTSAAASASLSPLLRADEHYFSPSKPGPPPSSGANGLLSASSFFGTPGAPPAGPGATGIGEIRGRSGKDDACEWLRLLSTVLAGSIRVANALASGTSVLVHCSDGWDRTAQLSSLAQLLLDPYARTLDGFAALVEKEWPTFGHRFGRRTGTGGSGHSRADHKDGQRSPVFLQWLDCVWQLWRQCPSHFQFNERLLACLADQAYAAAFGSFLFDCERQRAAAGVYGGGTVSVWGPALSPRFHRAAFINARYAEPYGLTMEAAAEGLSRGAASGAGTAGAAPGAPAAPSSPLPGIIPHVPMPRMRLHPLAVLPLNADVAALAVWPFWITRWT